LNISAYFLTVPLGSRSHKTARSPPRSCWLLWQ